MHMSQEIDKLSEALSKAQDEMSPAKKAANNPFHKSKYADLDDIWEAARLPLSRNGLSIMQTVEDNNGKPMLTTMLAHSSGQWISSMIPVLVKEATPQAFGSGITYARRYGLSSIVGITASEDDDGEAAEGRTHYKPSNAVGSIAPHAAAVAGKLIAEVDVRRIEDQLGDDVSYRDFLLKTYNLQSFVELKQGDLPNLLQRIKRRNDKRLEKEMSNRDEAIG